MKKLSLLFVALLLIPLTTLAQEGWFQQTSGTTDGLTSVYFTDNDTGWTVGGAGTVHNTTNGGESWNEQIGIGPGGLGPSLSSVYFTDNNTGWAVGNEGDVFWGIYIINTTDGGEHWNAQISGGIGGFGAWLFSVHFVDSNTGWTVGSFGNPGVETYILKTTDGGTNWDSLSSGTDEGLQSVYFTDQNNGWSVGWNGTILKTTDGGTNWNPQTSGTIKVLRSVHFKDNNTGWAVGDTGTILNTTDGGINWNPQSSGTIVGLSSVYFTDNNTGWVVGVGGTYPNFSNIILKTTDGGINWNPQTSGTTVGLSSVYFTDNNTGWVVGGDGTILHTTNGGVSFIEEEEIDEIPTNYYLSQNYPNPFNPNTKIRYSVPQSSNVVIKVFDILGNEIETLIDEEKAIGTYEISWYAEQLPSGIYFYRLQAGSFVETKKMVLMK